MTTCLITDSTLYSLRGIKDVAKLARLIDRIDNFTLYDYLFLSRVAISLKNCGD